MEFVETDVFTQRIKEILSDIEYGLLQAHLVKAPKAGSLIPGGKGLRKLRWPGNQKGKRGGVRIIYYLFSNDKIYMIYPYLKSETEDLTRKQLKLLARFVNRGVL